MPAGRPDDPLDLEARRRIYATIQAKPGIHFSEIVRDCEQAPTTVRYHLRVLERDGVVSSLEIGRYLRYYPREQGERFVRDVHSPEAKRTLAVLRQRVPLAAATDLLVNGSRTHGELAEAVGVSPSTMTHHLKRMVEAGVATATREGREVRVALARPDLVREMLRQYDLQPTLADAAVDLFEDLGF